MIARFFHRLWHYHCIECAHEELENKVCSSCEILRQQLAQVNQEKQALLNLIIEQHKPIPEPKEAPPMVQLPSKHTPWRVRAQMLEQASREEAAALRRNQADGISELEKELGVDDANQ